MPLPRSLMEQALFPPVLAWWKRTGGLQLFAFLVLGLFIAATALGTTFWQDWYWTGLLRELNALVPLAIWLGAANAANCGWLESLQGAPASTAQSVRFRLMLVAGWPLVGLLLLLGVWQFLGLYLFPFTSDFWTAWLHLFWQLLRVAVPMIWLAALAAASGSMRISWLWLSAWAAGIVMLYALYFVFPAQAEVVEQIPAAFDIYAYDLWRVFVWILSLVPLALLLHRLVLGQLRTATRLAWAYAAVLFLGQSWLDLFLWPSATVAGIAEVLGSLQLAFFLLPEVFPLLGMTWDAPFHAPYVLAPLIPVLQLMMLAGLVWGVQRWLEYLEELEERRQDEAPALRVEPTG